MGHRINNCVIAFTCVLKCFYITISLKIYTGNRTQHSQQPCVYLRLISFFHPAISLSVLLYSLNALKVCV